MLIFLLPLVALVMLSMPLVPVVRGYKTGKKAKNAIIFNLCSFFGIIAIALIIPFGGFVSAAEATNAVNNNAGLGYLAAALVTGLSSIGAGIAVGAAAPAAIGATAEEPKSFVKSLIFVALGEGVALYGILISILILGKL